MKSKNNEYFDRVLLITNQKLSEEIFSSIISGAGAVLTVTAMVLLIVYSALKGDVNKVVSFSLWGSFIFMAYIFSVLNHALTNRKAKKVFRVFDSFSGYLALIGTIIPIALIGLPSPYNWIIFSVFVFYGTIGIVFKTALPKNVQLYSLILNALIIITFGIFAKLFYQELPVQLIHYFILSFAFCLVGLVYRIMAGIRFNHSIFHLMILLANLFHYFAFMRYLL